MSNEQIQNFMLDDSNQVSVEKIDFLTSSIPTYEETTENVKNNNKKLITMYRNHKFCINNFSNKEQIIYSILLLIDSLTAKSMRIMQLKRLIKEEIEKIKINSMRNQKNETLKYLKTELLYKNNFSFDDEN
uniref:Uncharacterized protein n=1 Tax=Strongyloides stercoralis TaxID=6248 RepID=A0A0K0DS28_STRER